MKKKLSRILGVGLTLALLTSLLLTAAPALADVSQPTVDVDGDEISVDDAEYTLSFRINTALVEADDPTITIRFPDDTDVSDVVDADVDVEATSGIGSDSGTVAALTATPDVDDDTILEIELDDLGVDIGAKIGAMAYVQVTIANVINPSDPDTYTLEVQTSEEDSYVESEEYDIDAPTVGGFVYVYNPSNILLATYGGEEALDDADAGGHFDKVDYTIKVGPGTYVLAVGDITITGEGLTVESADGAEDTIIGADGNGFIINGIDITIDGFTIDAADTAITVAGGEDALITNCVITDATIAGIAIAAVADLDTTVSDNVIEDCATGITFAAGAPADLADVDITGNEITGADTGGAIVLVGGNVDIDITDNTITGNTVPGITIADGAEACADIDITGNTISENEAAGISVLDADDPPTDIVITGNTIADNEDEGISIVGWTAADSYIAFNDISGNDIDIDSAIAAVNARFNWWGTTVEDDFDLDGDDVDYEPWLMGEQAVAVSGFAVAVNDVATLDGKDECGVSITGLDDDAGLGADIISAFAYAANPEDEIDDAAAFYDVFMVVDNIGAIGEVNAKIKLYDSAINSASTAYFWTGDFWAECSDQDARNGIIYVSLTEDTLPTFEDLEATAFAVVAGEAVAELDAPFILTPGVGDDEISLKPTFAWSAVADADAYYFQLADNSNFVLPMVSFINDLDRLAVTAYGHVTALPYSTPYYWRVKAVSGTVGGGDLEESAWVSGVFVTMAEVIEEPEPEVVWTCPQCGLTFDTREALEAHVASAHPPEEPPEIIIEAPDVIVPLPAETPITPAWIYAKLVLVRYWLSL